MTEPHKPRPKDGPPEFVALPPRPQPAAGTVAGAQAFFEFMASRRSVRMFSDRPVALETIQWIVRAAGTAPSGANKQPWRFVAVQDADIKRQIREAAEVEEREFYARRASERWKKDLAPLGTDENKEYLEIAPWLIAVFLLARGEDGEQHYYTQESVGLASGLLLAAAHHAGLATLSHTPSPMGFLNKVLDRPPNERPFLLVPVGYPTDDCVVPVHALEKKPLDDILIVR
jgi:iodotyrosine deiodinase